MSVHELFVAIGTETCAGSTLACVLAVPSIPIAQLIEPMYVVLLQTPAAGEVQVVLARRAGRALPVRHRL